MNIFENILSSASRDIFYHCYREILEIFIDPRDEENFNDDFIINNDNIELYI